MQYRYNWISLDINKTGWNYVILKLTLLQTSELWHTIVLELNTEIQLPCLLVIGSFKAIEIHWYEGNCLW